MASISTIPLQPQYNQHFSLTYSHPDLIFDGGNYHLQIAGNTVTSTPFNNTNPLATLTATNTISASVVISTAVSKVNPLTVFTLEGTGTAGQASVFFYDAADGVFTYLAASILRRDMSNAIAISSDASDNLYIVNYGATTVGNILKYELSLAHSVIMDQAQAIGRPGDRNMAASDIVGNYLYSVDVAGGIYRTDLSNANLATNTVFLRAFTGISSTQEWNFTVDSQFAYANVYGGSSIYAVSLADGSQTTYATYATAISGLCALGAGFVYMTTSSGLYRYHTNSNGTGTLVGQVYANAGAAGGGGYGNIYYIYNGAQYIQLTLSMNITMSWPDVYNPYDRVFIANLVHASSGVVYDTFTINVICFLEGTRILCRDGDAEVRVKVEDLRPGTLVKTLRNGFVPVESVGHRAMFNPATAARIKDRLYQLSPDAYPELERDLFLTGCHSILADDICPELRERLIDLEGDVYVTDDRYRVPAYLDDRARPYELDGVFEVFHFALQNEDRFMNYGVFAEGLLVETTSIRYMHELSNMTLL